MADIDENAMTARFLTEFRGDFPTEGFDDGHEFDQGGKAENAVDFGDISDEDDLPEEEEATHHIDDGGDERDVRYDALPPELGGLPVQIFFLWRIWTFSVAVGSPRTKILAKTVCIFAGVVSDLIMEELTALTLYLQLGVISMISSILTLVAVSPLSITSDLILTLTS